MLAPARRTRAAILALLFALLLTAFVAASPQVHAAGSTGVAYGTIKFPQKDNPRMKVLWFTKDWSYLGTKSVSNNYYLTLPPGSYHLQFVDQRPSYKIDKYAPTDVAVTVRASGRTLRNVTMKDGAFITGTVKTHGHTSKNARVVAANQYQTSFETTADKNGQFAVGGLPEGKYSLFTYDPEHRYVGKSTYAGRLKKGESANVAINLTKRAGSLRVSMYTDANGSRKPVSGNPVVTAVSKATGQFWSAKVKRGVVVFEGLYPGRYTLVANGYGIWFGRTGPIEGANVKAGKPGFGAFTYTKRGGWVSGTVVDGNDESYALEGVLVSLFDADGSLLTTATSGDDGKFTLNGQFATMSDLTVTTEVSGGGWTTASNGSYCHFEQGEVTGVSITQGQGSDIGSAPVPHSTKEQETNQPVYCLPND